MKSRSIQKQKTRSKILLEARRGFKTNGFDATTIVTIANAAGVANGTVISHFPDKGALVAATFQSEISETVNEAFASLTGANLVDQLLHISTRLYTWYAQDVALTSDLMKETLFLDGQPGQAEDQQFNAFVDQVAALIGARLPNAGNPHVLATAYFVDYFGVLVKFLRIARLNKAEFDLDFAIEQLRTLLEMRFSQFTETSNA